MVTEKAKMEEGLFIVNITVPTQTKTKPKFRNSDSYNLNKDIEKFMKNF